MIALSIEILGSYHILCYKLLVYHVRSPRRLHNDDIQNCVPTFQNSVSSEQWSNPPPSYGGLNCMESNFTGLQVRFQVLYDCPACIYWQLVKLLQSELANKLNCSSLGMLGN